MAWNWNTVKEWKLGNGTIVKIVSALAIAVGATIWKSAFDYHHYMTPRDALEFLGGINERLIADGQTNEATIFANLMFSNRVSTTESGWQLQTNAISYYPDFSILNTRLAETIDGLLFRQSFLDLFLRAGKQGVSLLNSIPASNSVPDEFERRIDADWWKTNVYSEAVAGKPFKYMTRFDSNNYPRIPTLDSAYRGLSAFVWSMPEYGLYGDQIITNGLTTVAWDVEAKNHASKAEAIADAVEKMEAAVGRWEDEYGDIVTSEEWARINNLPVASHVIRGRLYDVGGIWNCGLAEEVNFSQWVYYWAAPATNMTKAVYSFGAFQKALNADAFYHPFAETNFWELTAIPAAIRLDIFDDPVTYTNHVETFRAHEIFKFHWRISPDEITPYLNDNPNITHEIGWRPRQGFVPINLPKFVVHWNFQYCSNSPAAWLPE